VRLQVPPLRERRDDIVHLATIFLQQFAALYRRPAHHYTPRAERALEEYSWPGNVRELQNLILTSVLFCDAPEVDVEDLQGLPVSAVAAGQEASPDVMARPAAPHGPADGLDPATRLRMALAREIALAVGSGKAPVPLGKWLGEDLVVTADRLAGGVSRRGAELLGLAESTYRRQLQAAAGRRASGLSVRSPGWPTVTSILEDLIRARRSDTDVCEWAEACLLAEIDAAAPRDPRTAAALLGVTEPTLHRRKAKVR
jgi:DNA-binding NtrC family response regulator